jgi:hypothetical protein
MTWAEYHDRFRRCPWTLGTFVLIEEDPGPTVDLGPPYGVVDRAYVAQAIEEMYARRDGRWWSPYSDLCPTAPLSLWSRWTWSPYSDLCEGQ